MPSSLNIASRRLLRYVPNPTLAASATTAWASFVHANNGMSIPSETASGRSAHLPILAKATDKLTGFGSHTCVQHINEIVNFDKSKKSMFDKS